MVQKPQTSFLLNSVVLGLAVACNFACHRSSVKKVPSQVSRTQSHPDSTELTPGIRPPNLSFLFPVLQANVKVEDLRFQRRERNFQ